MTDCNHLGPEGKYCGRPTGHDGPHSFYEDVPGEQGTFRMYQWNDEGVKWQNLEKGNSIKVHFDDKDKHEKVIDKLIADAREALPKGEVFEIRGQVPPREGKGDYGRVYMTRDERAAQWGMGWYWLPANPPKRFESFRLRQEPLFRVSVEDAELNKRGGFLEIARIKA